MPLQNVDLPAPGGPTTSRPKGMLAARHGQRRARVNHACERACASAHDAYN
jgi:hypothetical protein